MLARDPPGNVFDIPGNSVIDYSLSAKALEAGVYHVHTQLNVAQVGPGLGPGQTVVVIEDLVSTYFCSGLVNILKDGLTGFPV